MKMNWDRRRFLAAAAGAGFAALSPGGAVPEAGAAVGRRRSRPVTLGFAGDTMLGRNMNRVYGDRSPAAVWGGMLPRLDTLDGLCLNLECCLSRRGEPWPERRFHFRADPRWAVPALKRGGVVFANLANNHLLDFGEEALLDTVDALDEAGIVHAGAGADVGKARAPALAEVGALRVAFVSFTDQAPRYGARERRAGTAYVEMHAGETETALAVRRAVERARGFEPDLVVASLHWGPNWMSRPADRYRRFARWLVDQGVDIVHGHSAHTVQGVEIHRGRLILHDCGDFVDDYAVERRFRNDLSFLFEVTIGEGIEQLCLVPVEIRGFAVHPAGEGAVAWLHHRMRTLSSEFGTRFEASGRQLLVSPGGEQG